MTERRPLTLRTDTATPQLQEMLSGDLLPTDTLGNALQVVLQGLITSNNAGITPADTVLQALGKLQAQSSEKVDVVQGKGLSSNDFTDAERQKLADVAAGAQVNVATNLALGVATANAREITSSTGGSVTLPAATSSTAGLMTAAESEKLSTVATNASANSSDAFLLSRANHSGTQPINTVAGLQGALDAALRVQLFSETTVKDFLTKIIALGPGYYRNSVSLPGIYPDSAGTLSLTADTFAFISTSYQTGETSVISGNTSGVAAGTWQTQNLSGETGTNANGTYIKHANGVMECWGRVALPLVNPQTHIHWTFPAAFTSVQFTMFCIEGAKDGGGSQSGTSNLGKNGMYLGEINNTGFSVYSYAYAEPLSQSVYLMVSAKGRWK